MHWQIQTYYLYLWHIHHHHYNKHISPLLSGGVCQTDALSHNTPHRTLLSATHNIVSMVTWDCLFAHISVQLRVWVCVCVDVSVCVYIYIYILYSCLCLWKPHGAEWRWRKHGNAIWRICWIVFAVVSAISSAQRLLGLPLYRLPLSLSVKALWVMPFGGDLLTWPNHFNCCFLM
jgi:hypothetical protein